MKQLLLIEPDSNFSKVIKLNVMKAYDLNVIEKNSVHEAIDLLEMLPDISLIIMAESEHHSKLFDYVQSANSEVPVLYNGKSSADYKKLTQLSSEKSWASIVEWTGKILNLKPMQSFAESKFEFVPVPASYFLNIRETSMGCDVYIRVKKAGESQFIKRLNSTDYFERADIEKYLAAGLQEFFIKKEHFDTFVNFVTDQLILQLSDKALSAKERIRLGSEVYEVTADRISSLGIDERTVEIVTESVSAMQATLGQGNALSDFMKLMTQNQLSFAYAHCFLNCLLLNSVIRTFEWNSDSIREKITYMSYFHDISLKMDEIERFHQDDESLKADKNYLNHALRSAEIVEKFHQVPIGIGPLIREHHGVKSGVGVCETLSNTLSPISMAFMVVESFTGEFMKISGTPTMSQVDAIFKKLSVTYCRGTYAQALQALQQTLIKKPA